MYTTLYQYLIIHHYVTLPGIGTIKLHRHPSQYNVADKSFNSPYYSFELRTNEDQPEKTFYHWFAAERNVTEWDAVRLLNEFSFDIRRQINSEGKAAWEPVGVFTKDGHGNLKLESKPFTPAEEPPVLAEKVIREKAQHTMRVGEREKTSSEMEVMLTTTSKRKRKAEVIMLRDKVKTKKRDVKMWAALILTIILIILIAYHFSNNGLSVTSTGNQSKVRLK